MKRFLSSLVILNFLIFVISGAANQENSIPENSPLYFGNPSYAVSDENEPGNYLMEKTEYTLSYNNYTLSPNWVAWHLDTSNLGEAGRSDKFKADKELPENWYAVTAKDYQFNAYGFDRGHVCPSADRTASVEANQQTFLMSNMLPQAPDCNRIVWKALEDYERKLADAGNELYIFAGGFGRGGTGSRGYFEEINLSSDEGLAIQVPEFCWKIILVLPEGDDDLHRVTADTQIIAVCIPNTQGCGQNGSWEQYECSVDYIESITNYDFFTLLDDDLETILEM